MSVVYKIKNIIANDFYIGSTCNFQKRKSTHTRALNKNKHHSKILQRAVNKYGLNNFVFQIIEQCEVDQTLDREQFYIDTLKPKYNVTKNALAPMQGRKHTDKTKQLLKSRRVIKGAEHYAYGKSVSKELRERRAKARVGLKRSDKFKANQRSAALRLNLAKNLQPYIEANKKSIIDSLGNTFGSLVECAAFHKISVATVCDILKGRHKQTRNKISFKYLLDNKQETVIGL